ncbi:MAG: ATP-dependent helicase HelY [Nocardioidaceae bacterium]|jgi:ATP-dependent RNA helicase HelY|nr:ATP-dependent helicase HelY [Nocardioidaceae bacterium]
MTVLSDFAALYDFPLDDFQRRACESLDAGQGILVAAPTGSGKTVVGEFAVHLALAEGGKCFYTTPIKALSNQKYADLTRRYGAEKVGLLTGDNSINAGAPVIVMTTEVLRNMLYARSATLAGLRFVVMDEVHYLADRSRGAVWEEVIIHLPESISIVSLSATVSNAEEFGEWLRTVRGNGDIIVEERRPVPLFQHVMVGRRMFDLFADGAAGSADDAEVNPELVRVARDDWSRTRVRDHRAKRGGYRRPAGRALVPSRVDVVDKLESEGLLPAIMFIFSRAGCDAAVQQTLNANLRLTTAEERHEIRAYAESRVTSIAAADLDVLGYRGWREALERGISAHHAGMLPVFKECVEQLFSRGLVKMVFATETLALGINMPARSVVIDRLSKWNGETHADVTPGEYTQLTGRAGRRGIDVEGHAVVLWAPGFDPKAVAGLASTRTYPLRSSFRPSYNMAVNLVQQFGKERARALLESSFAQFQADRAVVGLARELRRAEEALDGYAEAMSCSRGDFMEYATLRRRLSDVEASQARSRKGVRASEAAGSLERLKIGDVISVPAGRWAGPAVVLDLGARSARDGAMPLVLTLDRQAKRLSVSDFPTPVEPLMRLRIPKAFNPRNAQHRRELAVVLRDRTRDLPALHGSGNADPRADAEDPEVRSLRARIRAHPCHACPDREQHARWAERYLKLEREAANLRRRIEQRTNTIAREFDRVCDVLEELGYLDGEVVTATGSSLSRIYSELDLLAAECLRRGTWRGLEAPGLAAALSALVFESRKPDEMQRPRVPGGAVRSTLESMTRLWAELDAVERAHNLSFLREPDLGFAWAAYRWAGGAELDDVLEDVDLAAGDFVRWVKQVLDVADQVAAGTDDQQLTSTVRELVRAMRRGVVAYSVDLD